MICRTGQICIVQSPTMNFIFSQFPTRIIQGFLALPIYVDNPARLSSHDVIYICRGYEVTKQQMTSMSTNASVYVTRHHYVKEKTNVRKGQDNMMPLLQCNFCGKKHIRKKELCPAWQKKCSKCHRQNHFAVCCQPDIRKRVNNVDRQEEHSESSESGPGCLVNVVKQVSTFEQDNKSHSGPIYVEMIIVVTKQLVKLQVDCCKEIYVISKSYIPNVRPDESSMTLQKCGTI